MAYTGSGSDAKSIICPKRRLLRCYIADCDDFVATVYHIARSYIYLSLLHENIMHTSKAAGIVLSTRPAVHMPERACCDTLYGKARDNGRHNRLSSTYIYGHCLAPNHAVG